MKCPKCGFTSFDYLDNCKKCGADVSDVRSMLGVIAVAPEDRAVAPPQGPPEIEAPDAPATEDDFFSAPPTTDFEAESGDLFGDDAFEVETTSGERINTGEKSADDESADEFAAADDEFLQMDLEDVFKDQD